MIVIKRRNEAAELVFIGHDNTTRRFSWSDVFCARRLGIIFRIAENGDQLTQPSLRCRTPDTGFATGW